MLIIISSFLLLQICVFSAKGNVLPRDNGFQLHIVHLNDFHARFEETSKGSGVCKEDCIGGFSRAYSAILQLKRQNPDAIVLNVGDNFQGTLWYNLYKWNVTQHFLNKLPTDAYTLGNHEFDDGIDGVTPFLNSLKAPIIAANIDDSNEPRIQGKFNKSIIVERNGKRIGIIGAIISTTDQMARTENLKFFDEVNSINEEADRLTSEDKVDTIVVLSHCGYDVDQKIAANAGPKIGLIVGAHSHTFLYTGDDPPEGLSPLGPYPTIVKNPNGQDVLIVQASAYTKFLGNITVQYDGDGNVVAWSGAPIYLNKSIPQDEEINKEIAIWKKEVDKYGQVVLGKTRVLLDHKSCRVKECNFGNFVTDAMIYAHLETNDSNAWTNASIAFTNAGGLRSSIEIGDITVADLATANPFENTLDIGEIQGKYIWQFVETAANPFYNGRVNTYLNVVQVSGLRLVYNTTNPVGSRVVSVKVKCRECTVPVYEDLNHEKYYRVVLSSFLATGGDGFTVISENLINRRIGPLDLDVLQKYINKQSPIIQGEEGRIQILK